MYRCLFLLLLVVGSKFTFAQKLSVPGLVDMLDWTGKNIDSALKKQGYLLMHKEVDSGTALFQYSELERKPDEKATVHTFSYMDVSIKKIKSRLITYRTYNKEEYQEISSYLLANNYTSTGKFDFGEAKHTLYSNGSQTIRVKVITTKLKDGKPIVAYELELGK